MIRTRTTIVVGAGAGAEIELPDRREMLARITQGFDFSRLGSELQSRDMVQLARQLQRLGQVAGIDDEAIRAGAEAIRTAGRITPAIEPVLDQLDQDAAAQLAGRLALVYYTLQAEAKTPLAREPRVPGELPLRGEENWLFRLGRMIVNGVPRSRAEDCFDELSVIALGYDRSLEHALPWVMTMAFGMSIAEARAIVAERLRITHLFGQVGRLPWQAGEGPVADWGEEEPVGLEQLIHGLHTPAARQQDSQFRQQVIAEIACCARLLFLGVEPDPAALGLMFDQPLGPFPEVMVALPGAGEVGRASALRMLRHYTGIDREGWIMIEDLRPWQLLRDQAAVLES